MNLNQAKESFLKYLKELGRSKSTITAYSKDIEQLSEYLKSHKNIDKIEDIDSEILKDYISYIKSDEELDYTLKTVSRKINSMKTFFKFMVEETVLPSSPAESVEHPKYETAPPRLLSKMEYMALRDAARYNKRLYTIVEILLQTGIRIGELSRLTIDDLNIDSKQKSITIKPYGSNEGRKVPLTQKAVTALKNYLKIRPKPKEGVDNVFLTKTGNPLLVRNIRTSITRALKKIDIDDATVNDIRNTFIVHQLKNGVPIERVGELVGHQRQTSTKRYLQLLEEKPKRKSNKVIPL